jgi:transcriptional regulator with XRE-family HTH domain
VNERTFYKVLGIVVGTVRRKMGMTAKTLAKKAGLSVGFLSDLENGKRGVSAYNLVRLAEALKVKPGLLLPEIDGPPF